MGNKIKLVALLVFTLFLCCKKNENTSQNSVNQVISDTTWCIYKKNYSVISILTCKNTYTEALKAIQEYRDNGIATVSGQKIIGKCEDCMAALTDTTIKNYFWVNFKLNNKPLLDGEFRKEDDSPFNGGLVYLNGVLLTVSNSTSGNCHLPSTFTNVPSTITYSFSGNSMVTNTIVNAKPIPSTPACPEFLIHDTIYRTNSLIITNQPINCDSMLYIIPGLWNTAKGTYTLTHSYLGGNTSNTFTPNELQDLEITGKAKNMQVIIKAVNYHFINTTIGNGTNNVKTWRFISESELIGNYTVAK